MSVAAPQLRLIWLADAAVAVNPAGTFGAVVSTDWVVALAAVQLGFLLGGSVVVETIFALDGLGYLAYQSITFKDFAVMQNIVLLLSVIYVVLTLAADVANAWLDPRIRVA